MMGAKLNLLFLEQRQLFDGAGFALAISDLGAADADHKSADKAPWVDNATDVPQDSHLPSNLANPSLPKELLVIDSSVEGWEGLAQSLSAQADILILSASRDGLAQIEQKLTERAAVGERYTTLHLLSHGNVGQVTLGSRTIDTQGVAALSNEFSQIGEGLAEGGDVLLYGCDVGSEAKGMQFLQCIANATHRDVAASNNATGATALGGDWKLEVAVGKIAAHSAVGDALLEDVGYEYLLLQNRPPIANDDTRSIRDDEVITNGAAVSGNAFGDLQDTDPDGDGFAVAGIQQGIVAGPVTVGLNEVIQGQWGAIQIDIFGAYTYTPNAAARALNDGQSAVDVFTYSICDPSHALDSATITILIYGISDKTPVNQPPIAVPDVRTLCESEVISNGQATQGNLFGDRADIDPEGSGVAVTGAVRGDVASGPSIFTGLDTPIEGQFGTLFIRIDGSYTYTPNAAARALNQGQSGADVFTYSICDIGGLLANTTISITVCGESIPSSINRPPVARPDVREVCEDDFLGDGSAIVGNLKGDIADSDPDGDALKVAGIGAGVTTGNVAGNVGNAIVGQWGTITVASNGTYIYQPNEAAQNLSAGESVSDVFTYTICDTSGALSTSTITINVCGQNDAPIARNDVRMTMPTMTLTDGSAVAGNTFGDVKDSDIDRSDVLTVVAVRPGVEDPACLPMASGGVRASAAEQSNVNQPIIGTYGTLTLKPDGTYIYQPNAVAQALPEGRKVQDVFTYTISDGKGGTDCAQITINMEGKVKTTVPPIVVEPPVVTPPVVVPPVVGPPVVTPPVVSPPVVVPTVVPPIFPVDTPRLTNPTPVLNVPLLAAINNPRTPLSLGSAFLAEQAGALPISPFGETPTAVKGVVVEAPPKEDCIPVQKASVKSPISPVVKAKVRPSIFTEPLERPNKSFSEQVKVAAKRFKPPIKVAPRLVEKEC
jgi:VCBS repeat-containing protein